MNEPNVDAIEAIIEDYPRRDGWDGVDVRRLATYLAEHGALVPSALTDEQAKTATDEGIAPDTMMGGPHEYFPEAFRLALVNIAKAGVARLPWVLPVGERLRSGDNVAVDPDTGKLVRWRIGLIHFCYAGKDVAAGETLTSEESFSG